MWSPCWTCYFRCRYRPWISSTESNSRLPGHQMFGSNRWWRRLQGWCSEGKNIIWPYETLMDWWIGLGIWLIDWLIDWLFAWLIVWLFDWLIDWLIKHTQIQISYCNITVPTSVKSPRLLMWKLPKSLLVPSCRPPQMLISVYQCAASHRPEHRNRSGSRSLWNDWECECVMCLNLLTNSSKVSNGWNGIFMELLTTSLEKPPSTYCTMYDSDPQLGLNRCNHLSGRMEWCSTFIAIIP